MQFLLIVCLMRRARPRGDRAACDVTSCSAMEAQVSPLVGGYGSGHRMRLAQAEEAREAHLLRLRHRQSALINTHTGLSEVDRQLLMGQQGRYAIDASRVDANVEEIVLYGPRSRSPSPSVGACVLIVPVCFVPPAVLAPHAALLRGACSTELSQSRSDSPGWLMSSHGSDDKGSNASIGEQSFT